MPLKLSVFPSEPLCFLLSSKIHREKLFIWKGHLTQFGEFAIHIVKNFQSEVSESFISFLYGIVSDFLSSKSKIKLIHFTFYKLLLLKKDQISTVGLFTKSSAWIYYCVIIAAGRSCHKMAKMPYRQFQQQLIKSVKLCNNYQLRSASDSVEMT